MKTTFQELDIEDIEELMRNAYTITEVGRRLYGIYLLQMDTLLKLTK
jgi:hypothetical protein